MINLLYLSQKITETQRHQTATLTVRVVGAPQMTLQPVLSSFRCSPPPSGTCQTCQTPGRFILDVVFPPLPLSALSSFPFHRALRDDFSQPRLYGKYDIAAYSMEKGLKEDFHHQPALLRLRQELVLWVAGSVVYSIGAVCLVYVEQ